MKNIIIYGPQGCGKPAKADMIAKHFGKSVIVQDWLPGMPMEDGAVVLTSVAGIDGALDFFEVVKAIESGKEIDGISGAAE